MVKRKTSATRRATPVLGVLLGLHGAASCAQDERALTQLILVADTDISDLDAIQFTISGAAGAHAQTALASRGSDRTPSFVSVVRDEGASGPLTVTAIGLRRGMARLSRTQRVSFVEEQTRVVALHLFASCVKPPMPPCDATQTCASGRCIAQVVPESDLLAWTGAPPPIGLIAGGDAGARDAGAADAGASDADTLADDGGANYRECGAAGTVDIQSDVLHCGGCESCLNGDHYVSAACVAGACSYVCASGFATCDDRPMNGCEADLARNENCGTCGNRCMDKTQCVSGVCVRP